MSLLRLFEQKLFEAKDYVEMLTGLSNFVDSFVKNSDYNRANERLFLAPLNMLSEYVAPLRRDKQIWVTKVGRAYITHSYFDMIARMTGQEEWAAPIEKLAHRYTQQVTGSPELNSLNINMMNSTGNIARFIGLMQHYDGVNFSKMRNYRYPTNATEREVIADLDAIEVEYKERATGKLTLQPGDKIILDLAPYYWIMLDRAHCPDEAAAMGHCGNSPAKHTRQRILSLRKFADKIDDVDYYEPCLTFILLEDGTLGEMKGKGNDKPAEHYHDQIEALLHLPMIKGLSGGGYKPENNFSMHDLGAERRRDNAEKKPELLTAHEQYEEFGLTDRFAKMLYEGFMQEGAFFFTRIGFDPRGDMDMAISDRDQLVKQYPILCRQLKTYYHAHGLTSELLDLLGRGLSWKKGAQPRIQWEDNNSFRSSNLSEEDRKKLFETYPDVMTYLEYYKLHGLDATLEQEIVDGVTSNAYHWYNKSNRRTEGFTPYSMSEADRHRLWTDHPEVMTFQDKFDLYGMTEELAKEVADGVEAQGTQFYHDNEFSLGDLSEANKQHLFELYPILAPFVDQLRKFGDGNKQFVKNALWACDRLYADYHGAGIDNVEWEQDKKVFVLEKWSNVRDLIEEQGTRELQYYADEDYQYEPENNTDHYHIDHFDNNLPLQIKNKLYEMAHKWEEDFDDQWDDFLRLCKRHDEELYDTICQSVWVGDEVGTSHDIGEAINTALYNAEVSFGKLQFQFHSRDSNNIDMDKPVQWTMTCEDMAKFIDDTDGLQGCGENAFGEMSQHLDLDVPSYGWSGYDESAAIEHFAEQTNFTDEFEPNPYPRAIRDKMSEKELRKAYEEVASQLPRHHALGDNSYSIEKLREKLAYVCQEYYARGGRA